MMATPLPDTGSEIDGFVLGARVHGGAQSVLYRVTQPGQTLPLIMKLPLVAPGAPGESIVGFETEATILPTLRGAHVPTFVAAGELTRTPYLVSEWIAGEPLEPLIERGPVPPEQAVRIAAAIADALHSVHQQDVVHHDLKPANVILRPDGSAVLIDFGFAHHARYPDLLAEARHFAVGSAPYVSPEQLLGTRGDPRSDLFALGVVLYELVTSELPFGEPMTDVRNRFWLDPTPPAVLAPAVPPWLQEIILRCLELRPAQRYQTAAHLAFDLRNPAQVPLTERASKKTRAGFTSHLRRFFRARAEVGPLLRSPAALLSRTPIVLCAVDTGNVDDPRHPAIHTAISQLLTQRAEFRLICLTVIPPAEPPLEHLVRLRHWVAPLRLPVQRLSVHAVPSDDPAEAIIDFAAHNHADLIVLGAPSEGRRSWSQSIASTVTAKARCSVHVVRLAKW